MFSKKIRSTVKWLDERADSITPEDYDQFLRTIDQQLKQLAIFENTVALTMGNLANEIQNLAENSQMNPPPLAPSASVVNKGNVVNLAQMRAQLSAKKGGRNAH